MATDIIRMHSIAHGGSPDRGSSLSRFVSGVLGAQPSFARAISVAKSAGHAVREGAEAGLVGAGLGAYDSHYGLDHTMGTHVIPVDAVAAAVGLLGSVALEASGHGEFAPDVRTLGSAAGAVFGYRKAKTYFDARKSGATTTHGDYPFPQSNANYPGMTDDVGVDPIVARARAL